MGMSFAGHNDLSSTARPACVAEEACGNYILLETLGSGATGVVRAGIDAANRSVAVKVLQKGHGSATGLNLEPRILRKLSRHPHPNIVAGLDLVRDKRHQTEYLVMERVAGLSLERLLQPAAGCDAARRLPAAQVASILSQTLSALAHLHRLGYVHGDVKPGNIMLAPGGLVKLVDFGGAAPLSAAEKTRGTPAYKAPEFLTGDAGASGPKTDVWALGVAAFRMLSGQKPFTARALIPLCEKIARGEYEFPEEVRRELPAGAVDAVARMLDTDFNSRWSVAQLMQHPWIKSRGRSTEKGPPALESTEALPQELSRAVEGSFAVPLNRTLSALRTLRASARQAWSESRRSRPMVPLFVNL